MYSERCFNGVIFRPASHRTRGRCPGQWVVRRLPRATQHPLTVQVSPTRVKQALPAYVAGLQNDKCAGH